MPVGLKTPLASVTIDKVKIAAIKIEENTSKGQQWIEVWLISGRYEVEDDSTTFVQYANPITGDEVFRYLKIETGHHPLSPETALGKCDQCGAWAKGQVSGPCLEDCGGHVVPYDGWARLTATVTQGGPIRDEIAMAAYGFLSSEEVPDPEDFTQMVKLLDAE